MAELNRDHLFQVGSPSEERKQHTGRLALAAVTSWGTRIGAAFADCPRLHCARRGWSIRTIEAPEREKSILRGGAEIVKPQLVTDEDRKCQQAEKLAWEGEFMTCGCTFSVGHFNTTAWGHAVSSLGLSGVWCDRCQLTGSPAAADD
jgi:UDP-N-acetylenolpyruvoylglucosamine reductase